jgi:hypothetical protein
MVGWPATTGQAAGVITHTEIVKRAYENNLVKGAYPELAALINTFRGIVNYGAMFPDWGMAVNILKSGVKEGDQTNYGDLAEGAHDTAAVKERSIPLLS